jgi:hypothetical protein
MSEPSPAVSRRAKGTFMALSLAGIVLLALYRFGVHSKGLEGIEPFLKLAAIQIPIYVFAAWLSLRNPDSRSIFVLALIFAALFRLSIIFSPPHLSDDIYRYIWDGRVQSDGINPYRYIPADESLAHLRDDKIYPYINRRDYAHTMYPPAAEGAFFLITRFSESVTWMKAAMVGFEAIAVWAIIQLLVSFGLARQRVLIYAWHPLTVWEFAGSGHVDAMAIAFVALAMLAYRKQSQVTTSFMLAGAALVKFLPAVLLPAFFRRWNWKMPLAFFAASVLAYLPYLSVGPAGALGFLPGYASERGMVNGEQFLLLGLTRQLLNVPTFAYLVFATVVLAAVSVWLIQKRQDHEIEYLRSGLIIASVFMLLLSPHFSWYFTLLIPFLCFIPAVSVFYLTLASFLLYLTWLDDTPGRVLMLKALMFFPPAVLELLMIRFRRNAAVVFGSRGLNLKSL